MNPADEAALLRTQLHAFNHHLAVLGEHCKDPWNTPAKVLQDARTQVLTFARECIRIAHNLLAEHHYYELKVMKDSALHNDIIDAYEHGDVVGYQIIEVVSRLAKEHGIGSEGKVVDDCWMVDG